MPYKENLKKATALKSELDGFRPLTPEAEKRIMQKFRLDWNYHSSHIEGNSLTYGETKALILFGQTAQAKPLKDHLEMSGHNEAIKSIEEVLKQERPLTESFLRELHLIILNEPYEVDAITPEGKPTKKTIKVGEYKTTPNHVKTVTGEIFRFATPEETPAKMHDLMLWYSENLSNSEIHPVLFATEFHYRFITIHPFDDGNGRIARLLMNFILMQKGYPPAIIKTEDKENYFRALQQADTNQIDFFFNYISEQVIHSLDIMIKGAKGESIEEPDDLDKKLALIKQEVDAEDKDFEIKQKLTIGAVQDVMETWGFKLFEELAKTTVKFNEFYDDPKHQVSVLLETSGPYFHFQDTISFDAIKNSFKKEERYKQLQTASARFTASFGAYKKGGLNPFGCNYFLEIKFEIYRYEILINQFDNDNKNIVNKQFTQRLLHKPLSLQEINSIKQQWGESLLNHLEYNRTQIKLHNPKT